MSVRKLGRSAGLVLVLAVVVLGGGTAASAGTPEGYATGASHVSQSGDSQQPTTLGLEWD